MMLLDDLLKQTPTDNSLHDCLIKKIISIIQNKHWIKAIYGNGIGEIDLLCLNGNYDEPNYVKDVLLLFEIKTITPKNNKYIKQLTRAKKFLINNSDYRNVDCLLVYGLNKSYNSTYVMTYLKEI